MSFSRRWNKFVRNKIFGTGFFRNSILVLSLFSMWLILNFTPPCNAQTGNQFYASPQGSSTGDGSLSDPWDLQTAVNNSVVGPGDTIWLRGGTYKGLFVSRIGGTPEAPIIVRSFPGEWAKIDTQAVDGDPDAFQTLGSFTWFWGFEITNSNNRNGTTIGRFRSDNMMPIGIRFINLVIPATNAMSN